MSRADFARIIADAVDAGGMAREPAEALGAGISDPTILQAVLEGASESKQRRWGSEVSFARNVFIPLTNLCRDRCSYCTFAKQPDDPDAKTYTLGEVDEVVRGALGVGCREALFCLGDKPEIAHKSHREWLASRGLATTTEFLVEACRVSFEAGLLPHTNAGILSIEEMEALRPWNASMGLMLESTSPRLRRRGMAHYYAPDKDPEIRLRMHEEAGQLKIPFTTGILLGIGENALERVDTLFAIRDLSERHGHIQEVIVQPFHAKPDTPMRGAASLSDDEIAGWVGLARLILGPEMNVQAPPNLAPEALETLLRSGLNDWGGVSPVTIDFINPEAPWPELSELRERTEAMGQHLVERLPVYPRDLLDRPEFLDPRVRELALCQAGPDGWAKPFDPPPPGPAASTPDSSKRDSSECDSSKHHSSEKVEAA